jgi:hypothetical protein
MMFVDLDGFADHLSGASGDRGGGWQLVAMVVFLFGAVPSAATVWSSQVFKTVA